MNAEMDIFVARVVHTFRRVVEALEDENDARALERIRESVRRFWDGDEIATVDDILRDLHAGIGTIVKEPRGLDL